MDNFYIPTTTRLNSPRTYQLNLIILMSSISGYTQTNEEISRPVDLYGFIDDGQAITFVVQTGGCFSAEKIVFSKVEMGDFTAVTLLQNKFICEGGVKTQLVKSYQELGLEKDRLYKFTNPIRPLAIYQSSVWDGFPN
jgi:hypothetical protein